MSTDGYNTDGYNTDGFSAELLGKQREHAPRGAHVLIGDRRERAAHRELDRAGSPTIDRLLLAHTMILQAG